MHPVLTGAQNNRSLLLATLEIQPIGTGRNGRHRQHVQSPGADMRAMTASTQENQRNYDNRQSHPETTAPAQIEQFLLQRYHIRPATLHCILVVREAVKLSFWPIPFGCVRDNDSGQPQTIQRIAGCCQAHNSPTKSTLFKLALLETKSLLKPGIW